jgi:hypothetical protein
MITYVVRFDDNYAVDSLRQHRALAKSRWLHWPLKIICGLGMLALAALGVAIKSYVIAGAALLFLALLAAGPYLDYFVVKRRYRKQPLYGAETTIELSEDGIKFTSQHYNSDVHWPSLASARGFTNGLMLYLAPWHYFWLSDAACRSGDPDRARKIARSKLTKYHGV